MAKAKKITKEELKELTDVINNVNQVKISIADVEQQKLQLFSVLQQHQEKLKEQQSKIEEKYGQVTLDLSNGDIITEDE